MAQARPESARARVQWAAAFLVLVGVFAFAAFVGGARVEAPTFGLVLMAGALMFVLAQLYRVAGALARAESVAFVDAQGLASVSSLRELREEKKRVLKAIKELDFDHEMGKISEADYRGVRERYQLRAVEVMRALDGRPDLHPRVQELLRDGAAAAPGESPAGSEPEPGAEEAPADPVEPGVPVENTDAEPTKVGCLSCGAANDPDANFCKGCGAKI